MKNKTINTRENDVMYLLELAGMLKDIYHYSYIVQVIDVDMYEDITESYPHDDPSKHYEEYDGSLWNEYEFEWPNDTDPDQLYSYILDNVRDNVVIVKVLSNNKTVAQYTLHK